MTEPDASEWRTHSRVPLWILGTGLVATALAVVGFWAGDGADLDLDRFDFVKELCFFATAIPACVILLASRVALDPERSELAWWGVVVLGAISALGAVNPWCAWRGVGVSLASVSAFVVARHLGRTKPGRDLLLGFLVAAATLCALAVLLEAYGVIPQLSVSGRTPAGTLGVRNYAGHIFVLAIPALGLAFLQGKARLARIALIACGIIVAAASVLTRSRAAYLGFAVLLALLVALAVWLRSPAWTALRPRIVAFLLVLIVGASGAILLPNKLAWKSSSPYLDTLKGISRYEEGTGKGRLIQYGYTLKMARTHPLVGVGPGNWFLHYGEFAEDGITYHPDWLFPTPIRVTSDLMGFSAERGFPALALLAWGLFQLVAAAFRRLRRSARSDHADLPAATMLLSVGGLCVVALLDCVLQLPFPSFFFFTLVGLLSSEVAAPARETPRPLLRTGATVTLVVMGAALIGISGRETLAVLRASEAHTAAEWSRAATTSLGNHRLYFRAAWVSGRANCPATRALARRSLELFPGFRLAEGMFKLCPPSPKSP